MFKNKLLFRIPLFVMFTIFVFVETCYAEQQVNTEEIARGFWELYTVIRGGATLVGVLTTAVCGYHMLIGNSSDFEKYKKIAILSAIAVGAIWALPTVITFVKGLVGNNAWNPANPGI